MNHPISKYSFLILLLFELIDIALFGTDLTGLKIAFALSCYGFVLFTFCLNSRLGLFYLISFNILTIGFTNYTAFDNADYGYWGLRAGPVSMNIVVQGLLFGAICLKKGFRNLFCTDSYSRFFIFYFLWTALVGFINLAFGRIYGDNFQKDLFNYLPVIFYTVYFKDLRKEDLVQMFRYCFTVSIIGMLWGYALERYMMYGAEYYTVYNSMFFLIPPGVFILRKYFSKSEMIFFICSFLFVVWQGAWLMGGKIIVIYLCLAIWLLSKNKYIFILSICCLGILIPLTETILTGIMNSIDDPTFKFKISQILDIFIAPSAMYVASLKTSMGNLVAELITLVTYLFENPLYLIFGKGNGAGIPDIYGFLRPFTRMFGYEYIDAYRNDYTGLHLACYLVFLRGGIIFFVYYLKLIWGLMRDNSAIAFLAIIMFLFNFVISKDFLLLTYLLLRMCAYNEAAPRKKRVRKKPRLSGKFRELFIGRTLQSE